jgi:hypothetical protein
MQGRCGHEKGVQLLRRGGGGLQNPPGSPSPEGGAVAAGGNPVGFDHLGFGRLGWHPFLTQHLTRDGVH